MATDQTSGPTGQAQPPKAAGDQADQGAGKSTAPLQRVFPVNPLVWREASRMASNKNVRVEDLALCALQDPVIVLELLKTSNALYFSTGRPPITTATTAIIRLGSDVVVQTLDGLLQRSPIEGRQVKVLFERQRNRCKRAAIIARMLAEIVAKNLNDDCHTAGLFMFIGDMLAVAHLGNTYVKLHENNSASGLLYRLAQEHRFDVEKMGLSYLQRQGIPDSVLFAIDREGKTRSQDRAIMKPVCFAAAEIIDAFDANKWEKLAPGKQLPPKSTLRLLQLSEPQYLKLYERASEYLFHERIAYERISIDDLSQMPKPSTEEDPAIVITTAPPAMTGSAGLENDIQQLLAGQEAEETAKPATPAAKEPPSRGPHSQELADNYSLKNDNTPKKARTEQVAPVTPPPPLRTAAANNFVTNLTKQLEQAKNGEELLRDTLGILTETGPFEKSALIVVSKDRRSAIVVAARGPEIGCGQTLVLEDPLSPLAQCFSKVQSFGNRGSNTSPWGSKAFALAPIDADHETPVALYADCGTTGSITFEARRIFRAVVDILNQKLPTIPGGIPVEV